MITPDSFSSTSCFSCDSSSLIAKVYKTVHGNKEKTVITIEDDMDYVYLKSSYNKDISDELVKSIVAAAFEQASEIDRPASKYGKPVPEIRYSI